MGKISRASLLAGSAAILAPALAFSPGKAEIAQPGTHTGSFGPNLTVPVPAFLVPLPGTRAESKTINYGNIPIVSQSNLTLCILQDVTSTLFLTTGSTGILSVYQALGFTIATQNVETHANHTNGSQGGIWLQTILYDAQHSQLRRWNLGFTDVNCGEQPTPIMKREAGLGPDLYHEAMYGNLNVIGRPDGLPDNWYRC